MTVPLFALLARRLPLAKLPRLAALTLAALIAPTATELLGADNSSAGTVERIPSPSLGSPRASKPHRHHRDVKSIGTEITIAEGEAFDDVTIIGGSADIQGTVLGDLHIYLGSAKLGPKAEVRGAAQVFMGTLESDPGAKFLRGRHFIGSPPTEDTLRWLRAGTQWVQEGALHARLFPPRLPLSWIVGGVVALLFTLLSILFPGPLTLCAETLAARPGSSLLVGLLACLLAGPLMLLLTITVIGIPVVPVVAVSVLAAIVFGKLAVYRFSGQQLALQTGGAWLQRPLPALWCGLALFGVLYAIPMVGLLAWLATVPLGVGAVVLAYSRRFRRQPRAGLESDPRTGSADLAAGLMPRRVGFWLRFIATAIDFLAIGSILGPLLGLSKYFVPVWMLYHVVGWAWRGTTLGGLIVGLRVVRLDGGRIDFVTALVRCLASVFSCAVLFLGFFWAGWSRSRQSWHDRIAGTLVIKTPREGSLGASPAASVGS